MTTKISTREKILAAFVLVAVAWGIGLTVALIAKNQEVAKYEAVMDLACQKMPAQQSKCKMGLEMLLEMDIDKIKSYGSWF